METSGPDTDHGPRLLFRWAYGLHSDVMFGFGLFLVQTCTVVLTAHSTCCPLLSGNTTALTQTKFCLRKATACSWAPAGVLELPRELHHLRPQLFPFWAVTPKGRGPFYTAPYSTKTGLTESRPQYMLPEGLKVLCAKLCSKFPEVAFNKLSEHLSLWNSEVH